MGPIETIIINKNRGWRGLAEVICLDKDNKEVASMIFSFSQEVWDDMQRGYIVVPYEDTYMVLKFDNTEKLPKGQRSVLIKTFRANVISIFTYNKATWSDDALHVLGMWCIIRNFTINRNNHTTSDWNCVGLRVIPDAI